MLRWLLKAVVQERYGSPEDLVVREIDRSVPGDGEVLVRVRAASVHSLPRFFALMLLAVFVRQLPRPSLATSGKRELMAVLSQLLEAGQLTPVVDRAYPISEVPAALRYLMAGNPRGRVVITV